MRKGLERNINQYSLPHHTKGNTMTHLTINQVCELTALYRKGVTVPELAKKFNTDYETVIKLGRGGRATVFDFEGRPLFNGYVIECHEYCEKHPKKWGSMQTHNIAD